MSDDLIIPHCPPACGSQPRCCGWCGRLLGKDAMCWFEGRMCSTCFRSLVRRVAIVGVKHLEDSPALAAVKRRYVSHV